MHTLADNFLAWAEDPARTLEERYGILRLVESIHDHHHRAPGKPMKNHEADRVMREARRFNPAYQPAIDPGMLRVAAGLLPEVRELKLDPFGEERPLRDLGFLAFLPHLESLRLTGVEIPRLEALRHLPSLRSFFIRTDDVDDFSDLASCRELRSVKIQTWHPWPVLDDLETLPSVFQFHVRSVRPQDWSPLFDSTTLREVHQEECTAPQPDFETLQMLLEPADDQFAAPEPRPLPPRSATPTSTGPPCA